MFHICTFLVLLSLGLFLLHLITRLRSNRLIQNLREHVNLIGCGSKLVYLSLIVQVRRPLAIRISFILFDLLVALDLHVKNALLRLLNLGLLDLLIVLIRNFRLANQVISRKLLKVCCDLALFIVVVDVDELLVQVEFGLLDLGVSRVPRVQLKLLGHLADDNLLARVILLQL